MKQTFFILLGAIVLLSASVSVDASIPREYLRGRSSADPRLSYPTREPISDDFYEPVLSPARSVTPSPDDLPPKPIRPTHFPDMHHPQPHLPSYFEPSPFERPSAPKPQPDESD